MSQTSTGARVVFSITHPDLGDVNIAFANALNYSVAHNLQAVEVLGKAEAEEYSELGLTVNFTATSFRVSNQDAVSLGLRPSQVREIFLTQPELSATLFDNINNTTIMKIERVKCTQEDMSIDARSLGQLTLNFVGVKMSTEGG